MSLRLLKAPIVPKVRTLKHVTASKVLDEHGNRFEVIYLGQPGGDKSRTISVRKSGEKCNTEYTRDEAIVLRDLPTTIIDASIAPPAEVKGPDDLTTPYVPIPIYYKDSHVLEYVTKDVATVGKRVDDQLEILVDMEDLNEVVGVRLSGIIDLGKL